MVVIVRLLFVGLVVGAVMTFSGLLAPIYPPADFPNHFRLYTLLGCVILMAVAALARNRLVGISSACMCLLNFPLAALPLSGAAAFSTADQTGQRIKIISFNIWNGNQQISKIEDWINKEDADLVVLQEVSARTQVALRAALARRYPYIFDCGCNELLVASKRPWLEAGGIGRTERQPSLNWLRFDDGNGGSWRFVGLRTVYPMRPHQQAHHYRWLVREIADLRGRERLILAGDFNLTPWSLQLQRFIWRTGLRRHGMWARSWNAKSGRARLLLIDNVMASPDINSVSFTTGPDLGSDHLPVIATLALP